MDELIKLKIRKQKAEELSVCEFAKWKSAYLEICEKIIKLEKQFEIFDEAKAIGMLTNMVRDLSQNYWTDFSWDWVKFKHAKLHEKLKKAETDLDKAFIEKSITRLELAIRRYKDFMLIINELYKKEAVSAFMQIRENDSECAENPFLTDKEKEEIKYKQLGFETVRKAY